MHIAIIAPGSRGDVQPYVALGKALQATGHGVRLVTHTDFRGFVESHGVEFWPLGGEVQSIAQSQEMRARLEGGNFLAVLSLMAKEAKRGALVLARDALAACQGVDLLLGGVGGLFTGIALAEKLELPLLQAYYIPFTPTSAYPSFLVPKLPPWPGGALNRLSYGVARQMMWQGFRSADRRARQEVLDLPPAPLRGPFNAACLQDTPILYGFSPAVIPKPPDWDGNTHVTGYWFLDDDDGWTPPPDLAAFLEAGPPPVYAGFGSMGDRNPAETAGLIIEALARAGERGILLSGWSGMRPAQTPDAPRTADSPKTADSAQTADREGAPDSVFMLDSAPFSWLFPRMAAIVHHGGAGTTSAALRAGVPSVVVPFMGDQPFWGRRVAELGAGPEPIPRKRLTVDRLAQAIQEAVSDGAMRRRAADLGAKIQAEDGVGRAVAVIGQMEE